MPSNILDPRLSDVSANTFIQDSKVDTTVADAFTLVANTAVEVGKSVATNSLTGGSGSPDEVAGDATLLPDTDGTAEEQSRALESITDLKKLSAARKAGLPLAQAKSRATRILKEAMNSNPFFADDIRKEYQSYFGGSGASIFAMTPQEKEVSAYNSKITAMSLNLGISEESAISQNQDMEEMELEAKRMAFEVQKRGLNSDSFVQTVSINSNIARKNFSLSVIAAAKPTGGLSAEQKQSFLQQLPLLEAQLIAESQKMRVDSDGKPIMVTSKAIENARREVDDTINSLKGLVEDSDMFDLLKNQIGNTKNNFDIIALKHFGAINAVHKAIGPEATKYVIQALNGNESYRKLLDNDPYFKSIVGRLADFDIDVANWGGKGVGALFNASNYGDDTPDNTELTKKQTNAGVTLLLSGKDGAKIAEDALGVNDKAENVIAKAVGTSPGSLFNFSKPEFVSKAKKSPATWKPVFEKSIEQVRRSTMSNYMMEQGEIPVDFDIRGLSDGFAAKGSELAGSLPVTRIRATGTGMTPALQFNISAMYQVAQAHPMIWEDKHSSSLDYVRSIFKLERGVRQNDRPSGN
jgi:uncharacterized protein YeaC (DUF1315 family)